MKKIKNLFCRNYDTDGKIRDEIEPDSQWVADGEGVATRKWDGTCCKIEDGKLYKRYDAKGGKTPPAGFVAAQDPDPVTGHWPGWLLVGDGPEDRWFREWSGPRCVGIPDGTYELCGPKINGNPDRLDCHILIRHGVDLLLDAPRTFEALRDYLSARDIEGIVWHRGNGDMVKVKGRDFGIERPKK